MQVSGLSSTNTASKPPEFSRSQARSFSAVAAFTTSRKRSSFSRKTIRSSIIPPRPFRRKVYLQLSTGSVSGLVGSIRPRKAMLSAPPTSIAPMWLTSKSPAAVRTASCSLITPEYSRGVSQPWNSKNFAPNDLWWSYSSVFFIT